MSGPGLPGLPTPPSDPTGGATRGAVVLPLASAERAADLCALAGTAATCVPVPGAGVVALPQPAGGVGPALAAVDVAERASRLLRGVDVVLLLAGEDQVSAQTWRGGARVEGRPAGLLLASWPDDVARLLLGRLDAAAAPGAASSAGRGRWRAVRSLLRARRG